MQKISKKTKNNQVNETSWYGLFYDLEKRDKANIKQITMVPTNINQCKIYSDGKSVYSSVLFYAGDIIEICPTKIIDKTSLYTRDVRDIVFEIIPTELFVIPFGYCQYYDIISRQNPEPNCDYEWNYDTKTITIRALRQILKHEKLVLNIKK